MSAPEQRKILGMNVEIDERMTAGWVAIRNPEGVIVGWLRAAPEPWLRPSRFSRWRAFFARLRSLPVAGVKEEQ